MDIPNNSMDIFKKVTLMNVDSSKIRALIEFHGRQRNYPTKSFVPSFVEDFKLNYNQWSAYTKGTQNIGIKVIQQLMEIFPELNLNWLLKDEGEMFVAGDSALILKEQEAKYGEITNEIIYRKLEEIQDLIVKK